MHIKIKPFNDHVADMYVTRKSQPGDAGFDLYLPVSLTIPPRTFSYKIPLQIAIQPTQSFYLYPRSSMGSKTTLRLSNSVGIIDSQYRGELCALVDNLSDSHVTLKKGERYFQICSPDLGEISSELVNNLDETVRGERGFGHGTGN